MLDLVFLAIIGLLILQNKEIMDTLNPIQELNNKVVELYGKLAKLEYELETLNFKKETMRQGYATANSSDKEQSNSKG